MAIFFSDVGSGHISAMNAHFADLQARDDVHLHVFKIDALVLDGRSEKGITKFEQEWAAYKRDIGQKNLKYIDEKQVSKLVNKAKKNLENGLGSKVIVLDKRKAYKQAIYAMKKGRSLTAPFLSYDDKIKHVVSVLAVNSEATLPKAISELNSRFYWWIADGQVDVFNYIYSRYTNSAIGLSRINEFPLNFYSAKEFIKTIKLFGPTKIMDFHFFSAYTLGKIREKGLFLDIPAFANHTDYDPAPIWALTARLVSGVAVPDEDFRQAYIEQGVKPGKVHVSGMSVDKAVLQDRTNGYSSAVEYRRKFFDEATVVVNKEREALGLRSVSKLHETPLLTLSSGGEGTGPFIAMLESIIENFGGIKDSFGHHQIQVAALTASSQKNYQLVEEWIANKVKSGTWPEGLIVHQRSRLPLRDFVAWKKFSEIEITKSGGLVPAEAFTMADLSLASIYKKEEKLGKKVVLVPLVGGHEYENALEHVRKGLAYMNVDIKDLGRDILIVAGSESIARKMEKAQKTFRDGTNSKARMDFTFGEVQDSDNTPELPPEDLKKLNPSISFEATEQEFMRLESRAPKDIEIFMTTDQKKAQISIEVDGTIYSWRDQGWLEIDSDKKANWLYRRKTGEALEKSLMSARLKYDNDGKREMAIRSLKDSLEKGDDPFTTLEDLVGSNRIKLVKSKKGAEQTLLLFRGLEDIEDVVLDYVHYEKILPEGKMKINWLFQKVIDLKRFVFRLAKYNERALLNMATFKMFKGPQDYRLDPETTRRGGVRLSNLYLRSHSDYKKRLDEIEIRRKALGAQINLTGLDELEFRVLKVYKYITESYWRDFPKMTRIERIRFTKQRKALDLKMLQLIELRVGKRGSEIELVKSYAQAVYDEGMKFLDVINSMKKRQRKGLPHSYILRNELGIIKSFILNKDAPPLVPEGSRGKSCLEGSLNSLNELL